MQLIVAAILVIASVIAGYFAAMAQRKRNSISASEVDQPTVNPGDRLGKLFGTRQIDDPKVVWMSATTTTAIKK